MITAAELDLRLRAEGLHHRYGARLALQPVTFSIEGRGTVAVTGENGSGKSTLLRIIAGLLRPSGGRCDLSLGDRGVPPAERRRVIGLATPELSFYEEMTARENLAFIAETRALSAPEAAVGRALQTVGLGARAKDRVAAFSSGMKQRLRLAFAILHQPPILLLDEPGSHLDDAGRAVVRDLVAGQARDRLVIIATNDPQEMTLAGVRIELRGRGLGDPA